MIALAMIVFFEGCSSNSKVRKVKIQRVSYVKDSIGSDGLFRQKVLISAPSNDMSYVFEGNITTRLPIPMNGEDPIYIEPGMKDSTGEDNDTLFVPYGMQCEIVLPIDRKIYLNSGSRLIFNPVSTNFQITGEAVFESSKHPAIVRIGDSIWVSVDSDSRLYVSNYTDFPEEPLIAGLLNGKAALQGNVSKEIKAGSQLQIGRSSQAVSLKVSEIDSNAVLDWTRQRFYFDDVDCYRIMKHLSRWYNVPLNFNRESVRHYTFRTIGKSYNESLQDFLDMINRTVNDRRFVLKDNKISVETH